MLILLSIYLYNQKAYIEIELEKVKTKLSIANDMIVEQEYRFEQTQEIIECIKQETDNNTTSGIAKNERQQRIVNDLLSRPELIPYDFDPGGSSTDYIGNVILSERVIGLEFIQGFAVVTVCDGHFSADLLFYYVYNGYETSDSGDIVWTLVASLLHNEPTFYF
jgi:hypothetical protein